MTTRVLAAASPGEVRVAVAAANDLQDYAIWRPAVPDGVGDLHRGRVIARAPTLGGAFVALDGADGFLPDSEGGKHVSAGTVLGVRISRAAQGGKGPRLSAQLSAQEQALIGTGPPALLRRGPHAILRLAALHPGAAVIVDDAALAAILLPTLGDRVAMHPQPLDHSLLDQIDALAHPELTLPEGARLSFHPTRALVAIDVDTASATGRHLDVNRALLPALARQIRLRNLSGAILVDFAGLPARRRTALGPALAAALAEDPLRPRLLGFTGLGLAEIVRPRVHPPLHEMLAGPHAAALAALRAIATEAAADPSRVSALRAAPSVAQAVTWDRAARADLARRTGRDLILRADPSLTGDQWSLEMS